jgi:hypothetical protein
MRKLIYGALALATALSVTAGVNTQSASAKTPAPVVPTHNELGATVNLDEQSMTVKGNTQISVAFPTVKADKSDATKLTVTVKSWDVYEGEEAVVDLSKLNPSKDSYVAIKDESNSEPQLLVFKAETRKFKAVYTPAYTDAAEPTVAVQVSGADVKDTAFEYRTAYSGWKELIGLDEDNEDSSDYVFKGDLSPYIKEGAQLNIRSASVGSDEDGIEDGTYTAQGYKVVVEGRLPSKEFKVKVAAQPSAPKVTADYKKNQYKLAAKTQYRLDYTGEWTTVPDNKILTFDKLTVGEGENAKLATVLQSRTAADSSKKKAASKITSVNITAPAAAPELIEQEDEDAADLLADIQEKATAGEVSILDTSAGGTVSPAPSGNVTVKLDAKKGTIIKNTLSVSIDVIATTSSGETVKTVKPNASTSIKYAAGTTLAIRYSAVPKDVVDKTTKTVTTPAAWASEAVELGTMVNVYVAPTPVPSASAAA